MGVTLAALVPGWAATLFTYGRHPRRRNEAAPASRPNAPKSARDSCRVLRAAAPQSATGGLARRGHCARDQHPQLFLMAPADIPINREVSALVISGHSDCRGHVR